MKKQVVGALFALSFLFALTFVSAAGAADGLNQFFLVVSDIVGVVFDWVSPIFTTLLGPESEKTVGVGSDSFLAAEILLLLIVFVLVYVVVDSIEFFDDHKWTVYIIAFAVSILSIRFLTEGWINSILLPYQALGITLTAALPFIVYFYFVEVKLQTARPFFRKSMWFLFAAVWIFMYATRYEELRTFAWIYLVAFLLSIAMLWIDNTIQRWLLTGKVSKVQDEAKEEILLQYRRNLVQANSDFRGGVISRTEWERRVKRIKAEIDRIARSP